MPNQEATPRRTVRVSDEIWDEVHRIARDRQETVSEVVRRALVRYVRTFGEDDDE